MADRPAVCQEAIDRYRLEDEATQNQRKRETAALEFQVPEKQWPDAVRAQRGGQVFGNLTLQPRVMLSIPTLDQPVQLVLNQERAASLSPTIHPVSEDADDDTAEVIQGLYRHIEVDSRANLARSWAFERSTKCGRGGWRILKEYDPDGGHPSDQKIVIKRLLYQESLRLDPYAQEPDFSDGDWGIVATWMPFTRFKRHWPDAKLSSYSDGEFEECCTEVPEWFREDKDGKAVLVVEYFRKVFTTRKVVALDDGTKAYEDEIPEGRMVADGDGAFSRKEEDFSIQWSKLTAVEELETEEWDGRYIPLVPSIGKELVPFDGERRWVGIIEPNMDAARMANYAASGLVETASLEPKAPFDVDPEEIAGFESFWGQANVRNFPYLPRHKFLKGQVLPTPARLQADMSKVQMNAMLFQSAMEFLHTGTGAWEAALGQSAPNTKTKGGTMLLQQQHEQGNSNWLDNLAEISLTYEAKVILDLIPRVYDRPGRVQRILGNEDKPKQVMLNAPFVQGKNGRPMPLQPGMPPQGKVKQFDLTKGRYGVVVTVGKAYQSRVQEGSDRLGQILQADPALVPVLGPNWMHFQDFPGAKEAEEVLKRMRDHQFPFLADQEEVPDAEAQLQKAQAMIQGLQQQLQQAGMAIQTKQIEQQGKLQQTTVQEQAETARTVMEIQAKADEAAKERETKLAIAELGAKVDRLSLFLEERARIGAELSARQERGAEREASQREAREGRAHEAGMAARGAQTDRESQGREQSFEREQGEMAHQQALEQGAQGIEGQIAVAASKPQPTNGGPA